MKNQEVNTIKNTRKEGNSKTKAKNQNNTIVTKNAKYVIITENNEINNKIENKKKTRVLAKKEKPLISKSYNIFNNIKLPKCILKYKTHSISAICLSLVSIMLLSGFSLLESMSVTPSLSNYYSAKSYTLFIDDKEIGSVREQETVSMAIKKLENEFRSENNTETVIASSVRMLESNANDSELISNVKLNASLKSALKIKSQGYGIYVNGQVVGILKSENEAKDLINEVKNYFTSKYDQDQIISADFSENISIETVAVTSDKMVEKDKLLEYILIGTDEKVSYTVQNGDTYWDIAVNNKMTVEELMSANPDANENKLMPGDELSLIIPKPFINVNIQRKLLVEEKIKFGSETQKVSYMYSDEKKIKTAGVYGKDEVEYIITEQNGIEIKREELTRVNISQPKSEVVLVGTIAPPPKTGQGSFINPLPGAVVSSAYGSRSGGFHRGIDYAKKSGSDIKAADGGTVTYAGWYGQYGYMVEINHGGGWTTIYAHCSKLSVKSGDKVYQGQKIAAVGSTGLSTGPHLHFEVRKYKVAQNPAKYVGNTYK
jgi:murein DD-endopeptidase MepM/ murein hydrolase activator NlpD